MRRKPVDSSSLVSVGYDAERTLLEIELVNGRVYRYVDVPEILYRRLLAAPSLGAFFNHEIRDVYAYAEVTGGGRPRRITRPTRPPGTRARRPRSPRRTRRR
jgi:hypothetical protein